MTHIIRLCTCTYVGSIADRFDELFLLYTIPVQYPVELCKLLDKDYVVSRFSSTSSWLFEFLLCSTTYSHRLVLQEVVSWNSNKVPHYRNIRPVWEYQSTLFYC